MAISLTQAGLLAWVRNLIERAGTAPASVGLTAGQMTAIESLYDIGKAAYDATEIPGNRSPALTAAKAVALQNLRTEARVLYAIVQNHPGVTDEQRVQLSIKVRKTEPSRRPRPDVEPGLEVVSINGRTVRLRAYDKANPTSRAMPEFCIGLNLFSFVGAEAPLGRKGWEFCGGTGDLTIDVTFDADVAPGAKVWFSAMWFNARKETSPPSSPLVAYLSGGATELEA